jgi:hypothetical protein
MDQAQNSPPPKKDKSYLIALLLLLLSGVCVMLFLTPDKKPPRSTATNVKSKEYEEKVNEHLFRTAQKIELGREKMEVETSGLAHSRLKPAAASTGTNRVDLSVDPRAESLVKDLRRDGKETPGTKNPNEIIQTELYEQEQLQNYSEEYKREYARQFVENAKNAGYRVIINDQFKVISVTPLRNPAQDFKLFDTNGHSVQ